MNQATAAKRILIVDDDPDMLTYLSAWLEDNGYETCVASDGHQGLEAILTLNPDLVLMDLKMPNQTGLQLYKQIRLRDALSHLPVVILTGMAEFELFGDGCAPLPQPTAKLDKPPNLKLLRHVIRQALGN